MMDNILTAVLIAIVAFFLGSLLGEDSGVNGIKANCERLGAFHSKQVVYDCKERK